MSNLFVAKKAKKDLHELMSQSYLNNSILSFNSYKYAMILPAYIGKNWITEIYGGVITEDLYFLKETNFNEEQNGQPVLNINEDEIEYINNDAIYLGFFHHIYGHCITDNLKRLWFLFTDEGKKLLNRDVDLVYITDNGIPLPKYAQTIIKLADVDNYRIKHISRITRYNNIYVPDSSLVIENHGLMYNQQKRVYFQEFSSIINRIKSKIKSNNGLPKKIYFTRSCLKNNLWRESGEREIEKVFRKLGYSVIAPEQITINEQLELLKNCTHFAATEGSIAHNALFCSPGTEVTILRKADYYNTYQFVINEISNVNVSYVDAYYTRPPYQDGIVWIGPFYLGVTKYVKRYASIFCTFTTRWLHISWWIYYLTRFAWFMKYIGNRRFFYRLRGNMQDSYNKTCECERYK